MSCVLICDDVRYLRTICDDVYYLHEHRSSSLLLVLILKSFSFLIPQDSHPPLTIRPRSCNDPALLLRNPNSNYSEDVSATLWISTSRKRPTLGERYECCPHYQTPCSNFCPVQFYSLQNRPTSPSWRKGRGLNPTPLSRIYSNPSSATPPQNRLWPTKDNWLGWIWRWTDLLFM